MDMGNFLLLLFRIWYVIDVFYGVKNNFGMKKIIIVNFVFGIYLDGFYVFLFLFGLEGLD